MIAASGSRAVEVDGGIDLLNVARVVSAGALRIMGEVTRSL